jgi:hypothetical protein
MYADDINLLSEDINTDAPLDSVKVVGRSWSQSYGTSLHVLLI